MIQKSEIEKYTESDVEMKLILPLLKLAEPEGLFYDDYNIQTKLSLKKILIDKGTNAKLYYPDFAIIIEGLPILIVEAKKPNEDLDEAYRQACLYANEINREFPTGINPCQYVISTDGLFLYAGKYDSAPVLKIPYENWSSTNIDFDKFINNYGSKALTKFSKEIRTKIGSDVRFKNPISLLGGKKIQNLESNNSFGENISIQYEHLFNPKLEIEKEDIVKNAYVNQNKVDVHISSIDTLFEKKIIDQDIQLLDEQATSLTLKFDNPNALHNQVLLLIGSVGAGKSTFTTYLREVALNEKVRKSTVWVHLNLNDAPLNKEEIYKWVKTNIISSLKKINKETDYDELEFLLKLYEPQIKSLKKGVLKLFNEDDLDYKKILAEHLTRYQSDLDLTLENFIRVLLLENNKHLVVVLDNSDKRNTEEQLLMFEVANWVKDNIKGIVFLPLRETTFENHRFEKPLDTVVKDLTFKIIPPSLEQVIEQRIKYISQLHNSHKDGFYYLGNGMKVKYPSKEEIKYLTSIVDSLFKNQFFKRLITGFAGRNIRNGIEIFLDFCKSGHINDAEITKILRSNGDYLLPNHLISKVFIRGNKVFYTDSNSRIKNLFHSQPTDEIKDPFVRISILKYLFENKTETLFKNFVGYNKTVDLIKELNIRGHDEKRVIEELKVLLKLNLIENETLDSDTFNINDLIKITSIGIANFNIVRNIDYLASIAEDMWYKDNDLANEITENLSGNGEFAHLSIRSVSTHARKLINYLQDYYNSTFLVIGNSISASPTQPIDFDLLHSDIYDFDKNIKTDTIPNLKSDDTYEGTIVNIQHYGIMCQIVDTPFFGLIHSSKLPKEYRTKYNLGGILKVKVLEFKKTHNKYNLILG